MLKRKCRVVLLILLRGLLPGLMTSLVLMSQVQAQEQAPAQSPVEVALDLFLIDLDGIDDNAQNFTANVYLEARWQEPDWVDGVSERSVRALTDGWNPRLQILNQQRVIQTFPQQVETDENGLSTYRQRLWGTFSQPLQLEEFPFDSQTLEFVVVSAGLGPDEIRLIPGAYSGASGDYSIPDWEILDVQVRENVKALGREGDNLPVVELTIEVRRYTRYYFVKVILPMVLIFIMSLLVFWIDPEQSGVQIALATTSMLTLIAYRFAVGASLPKLSFLTRIDYFILASTLLVFTCLIMVIWTSALARQGNVEKARKIDRRSRWLMPGIFALLALDALFLSVLH